MEFKSIILILLFFFNFQLNCQIQTVVNNSHSSAISSVVISQDEKYIISGSRDGIKVWDFETCRKIYELDHRWMKAVNISSDGKYIISIGTDEKAKIMDSYF